MTLTRQFDVGLGIAGGYSFRTFVLTVTRIDVETDTVLSHEVRLGRPARRRPRRAADARRLRDRGHGRSGWRPLGTESGNSGKSTRRAARHAPEPARGQPSALDSTLYLRLPSDTAEQGDTLLDISAPSAAVAGIPLPPGTTGILRIR